MFLALRHFSPLSYRRHSDFHFVGTKVFWGDWQTRELVTIYPDGHTQEQRQRVQSDGQHSHVYHLRKSLWYDDKKKDCPLLCASKVSTVT